MKGEKILFLVHGMSLFLEIKQLSSFIKNHHHLLITVIVVISSLHHEEKTSPSLDLILKLTQDK